MLKDKYQQLTYNAVLYPLVVAVAPSTAQFLRQFRHFDVLVQSAERNVDRLKTNRRVQLTLGVECRQNFVWQVTP
jgi:hypothetical protein